MRIIATLVVLVLVVMAYIRLAPSKVARWHRASDADDVGDYTEAGGFKAVRQINAPSDVVLSRLSDIARQTPRTQVLAGSENADLITFITRSRIMGFPDYTTAVITDERLIVYGRLRFGRSDFGVNRLRVLAWLEQLGDLIEAP